VLTQLFNVPLHFNFYEASQKKADYDLRKIFDGSLVQIKPELSVTFVDNHDTQQLQSLESTVENWFKPLAYALLLLREQGIPKAFFACLYGAEYKDQKDDEDIEIVLPKVEGLDQMMMERKDLAYDNQVDSCAFAAFAFSVVSTTVNSTPPTSPFSNLRGL